MRSSACCNAFDSGARSMKGNTLGALPGLGCRASAIRDLQEFRKTSVRSRIGLADPSLLLLDGLGDPSKSLLIQKDEEWERASGLRRDLQLHFPVLKCIRKGYVFIIISALRKSV